MPANGMQVDGEEENDVQAQLDQASQTVTVIGADEGDEEEDELCTFSAEEDAHRLDLYNYAWSRCYDRIRDILDRQHGGEMQKIVTFIASTRTREPELVSLGRPPPLPTALVVGGNQVTSHVLTRALVEHADDFVTVSLSSRDCTTLKSTLRSLITRFMDVVVPVDPDASKPSGRKPSMLTTDDMELFAAVYNHHCAKTETKPSIVVLFEDFEGFGAQVTADILYILRQRSRSIPFVPVFGISTSIEVLRRAHFRSTLSLIEAETFALDNGTETFNALVEGIFVNWADTPLDFGADAHVLLRAGFEDLDLSIDSAISKVQHAYLSHFLTSPYALATLHLDETAPSNPTLFTSTLDRYLLAPSLSDPSALPEMPSTELLAAMDKPKAFQRLIESSLSHRQIQQRARVRAYEVLGVLERIWREGRKGRAELVPRVLVNSLGEEIDRLTSMLKHTNDDTLHDFLIDIIALNPKDNDGEERYQSWLDELDRMTGKLPEGRHLVNGNVKGALVATDHDRAFTTLIAAVSAQISSLLRTGLVRSTETPTRLHELWTYNDERALRQAFYPSLQGSVTAGLGPAYDRLQDAGKLVNLADWYDSLHLDEGDEMDEDEGEARKKERERTKVASFVREVSALAYIGLVGPTKRKTEHVARLIW